MKWIKSLRLQVCLLASLLAVLSFTLANIKIQWITVIAVFFIATTTMLQNDWRDRFHDIQKGKTLAFENPKIFLVWLLIFWVITATLAVIAGFQNTHTGIFLMLLGLTALVYSETKKVPFLPIILVSLVSASPVLISVVIGANSQKALLLFFSAVLIIFAREITKDLDDKEIDKGYKLTPPLILGNQQSIIIAVVSIISAAIVALDISFLILPSLVFILIAAALLFYGTSPSICRKYLDLGMIFFILILIIF